LERERDIFLSSSFGFLSNDFSFKGVLHTVVVALESNALSFFREKERKKERKRREEEEEEENTRTTLVVVLVVFQSFLGFGFHDFVDAKR